jgi:hypothetical protein
MAIKDQLNKLKDNWLLIVLIVVVMMVMSGGMSIFSLSGSSLGSYGEFATADMARSTGYYPSYESNFAPEVEERVITKTSSMSTEVERGRYKSSEAVLKSIVSAANGFILNERVNQYDEGWKAYYSGYYTIKVPTGSYESVLSQLEEIGKVISFNENSADVTGRYTDLNTQLETEKARLRRYEQMYQEAQKIEDKINLNDRIFNQERTIKYIEDAIDNIDKRVDYSQISFSMSEKRSGYANITFVKFSELVKNIVDSTSTLLSFLFSIFPWAIAFLIIRFAWIRLKKR